VLPRRFKYAIIEHVVDSVCSFWEPAAMRAILFLAVVVGAFWAIDAYQFVGFYWTVASHEILRDVDKVSGYIASMLTGRGG
jgi:hypothetical protein